MVLPHFHFSITFFDQYEWNPNYHTVIFFSNTFFISYLFFSLTIVIVLLFYFTIYCDFISSFFPDTICIADWVICKRYFRSNLSTILWNQISNLKSIQFYHWLRLFKWIVLLSDRKVFARVRVCVFSHFFYSINFAIRCC